jgi:hypothetical protein
MYEISLFFITYQASYTTGIGSFFTAVKQQGLKLTTQLHLVPR